MTFALALSMSGMVIPIRTVRMMSTIILIHIVRRQGMVILTCIVRIPSMIIIIQIKKRHIIMRITMNIGVWQK